jgi:hypothetical protein
MLVRVDNDSGTPVCARFFDFPDFPDGVNSLKRISLFIPNHAETFLESVLDVVDVNGIDIERNLIVFILVEFLADFSLGLIRISKHLSSDAIKAFQEILGVEVLSCCEEAVDITRDQVDQCIHTIFIVEAQLLLIGLDLPQQLLLLRVEKLINEVEGLLPGLHDGLCDVSPFVVYVFYQYILNSKWLTILDF